jgi:hypothetical protein
MRADEGSIPKDAILAWESMKESEFIVNITPPKSPHRDFRWIVFFYVRCSYEITKNKHPLVPFFILADKDFSWVKGKQPEFIPVPLNLLPYQNSLQDQDLRINMIPKTIKDIIRDKNLLLPPRGVDPHKFFLRLREYRDHFVRWRKGKDQDYSQEVEKKYSRVKGDPKDLLRAMAEEMTGIFLKIDKSWRKSIKINSTNRIKKFKYMTDAEIRKRDKAVQNLDQYSKGKDGEIIRMRRICTKWRYNIILNARQSNGHNKQIECMSWRWEPVLSKSQWLEKEKNIAKM